MPEYMGEQRRAFYRVVYPPEKRPILICAGRSYEIVDLCERGVKIINKHGRLQGDLMRAMIKFRDGETANVVGRIQRVARDQVVLLLVIGVSFKTINKEQMFIRNAPL